jgi:hypothetical protein
MINFRLQRDRLLRYCAKCLTPSRFQYQCL